MISTDHLRVVAISAAISSRLSFQVFSFIVWIKTQSIEEGESFSSDGDRDLGAKLNVAPRLTANNRPDMGLAEADDTIRDTSDFRVVKNVLLSDHLSGNQELPIGILPSRQKACATSGQSINAGQIALEMTKLLLDRLADHVDSGSLLLCHCQELFPGLLTVCAWLRAKGFSEM